MHPPIVVGEDSESWGFITLRHPLVCRQLEAGARRGRYGLQRIFSTFPDGRPGVGLLLLRVGLGGTLIVQAASYLADGSHPTAAVWTLLLAAHLSGLLLLIGYMTPLAGAVAGILSFAIVVFWQDGPTPDAWERNLVIVLVIAIAAAVVCLGPGAFSLDARLFGRREIIVPNSSSDS